MTDSISAERARYTVDEAAVLLGVSRAYLYTRIAAGALKVSQDARRTFISRTELQRYVDACPEGCAPRRGRPRQPQAAA